MIERKQETNNEYANLARLLDASDDVDLVRLDNALEKKLISEREHYLLVRKFAEKRDLGESHLAYTAKTLAEQNERLGIDPVTGFQKDTFLKDDVNRWIGELNHIPKSEEEKRHPPLCSLVIIALDLDNLKKWNDDNGRHMGDKALQVFSGPIKHTIREGDRIFRRGDESDEIIVVMRIEKEATQEEIEIAVDRVRKAANEGYIEIEGKKLPVTAAVGYIVLKPGESRDAEQVLNDAHASVEPDKKKNKEARIQQAHDRLR